MQFASLGLHEPILRALASENYVVATPIQAKAIPPGLEGRDVLGCAQTGTGKTAAFALPILQRLSSAKPHTAAHADASHAPRSSHATSRPSPSRDSYRARCLVLCPTRELATQIADGFRAYGKNLNLRLTIIFGGVGEGPQVTSLRRGTDIIVATPGRLLDLMEQGHVDLRGIEVLVLDEADRMLDMGFIRDIRKIVAQVPAKRQTMFFSATMPAEIRQLADAMLKHPAVVQVTPVATTADNVEQSVYMVEKQNKSQLLAHLVNELPMHRAIVFTRTKHGADKVVRHLHARGIKAEAIHGNKSQNNRQRALENFKAGKIPVLIATDIASRGIDIDNVSHVVNYDLTHEPETYVHRIGRTARAGQSGQAISFCDREERDNLRAIERLLKRTIPVRDEQPAYEQRAAKPVEHVRPMHPPQHSPQPQQAPRQPAGRRDQQQRERQHQRAGGGGGASSARSQHSGGGGRGVTPTRTGGHRPAGAGASKPNYSGKVKRGGRRRGF